MKAYVVGFVFDVGMNHVLLIHKNRPEWQKGFVNGLGGKIEEGESSLAAVAREIQEESSLEIAEDAWLYAGRIYSETLSVEFFGSVYEGAMSDARTVEDEFIEWFPVSQLPHNVIENLKWLIPIVIDKMKNQLIKEFDVTYIQ